MRRIASHIGTTVNGLLTIIASLSIISAGVGAALDNDELIRTSGTIAVSTVSILGGHIQANEDEKKTDNETD